MLFYIWRRCQLILSVHQHTTIMNSFIFDNIVYLCFKILKHPLRSRNKTLYRGIGPNVKMQCSQSVQEQAMWLSYVWLQVEGDGLFRRCQASLAEHGQVPARSAVWSQRRWWRFRGEKWRGFRQKMDDALIVAEPF
jgi:hypothetical protein